MIPRRSLALPRSSTHPAARHAAGVDGIWRGVAMPVRALQATKAAYDSDPKTSGNDVNRILASLLQALSSAGMAIALESSALQTVDHLLKHIPASRILAVTYDEFQALLWEAAGRPELADMLVSSRLLHEILRSAAAAGLQGTFDWAFVDSGCNTWGRAGSNNGIKPAEDVQMLLQTHLMADISFLSVLSAYSPPKDAAARAAAIKTVTKTVCSDMEAMAAGCGCMLEPLGMMQSYNSVVLMFLHLRQPDRHKLDMVVGKLHDLDLVPDLAADGSSAADVAAQLYRAAAAVPKKDPLQVEAPNLASEADAPAAAYRLPGRSTNHCDEKGQHCCGKPALMTITDPVYCRQQKAEADAGDASSTRKSCFKIKAAAAKPTSTPAPTEPAAGPAFARAAAARVPVRTAQQAAALPLPGSSTAAGSTPTYKTLLKRPNGGKYHANPTCSSLRRSKQIDKVFVNIDTVELDKLCKICSKVLCLQLQQRRLS